MRGIEKKVKENKGNKATKKVKNKMKVVNKIHLYDNNSNSNNKQTNE